MRTLLLVILLMPSFLLSCREEEKDKLHYERTPDGYMVYWFDRGAVATGWTTKDVLFAEFDAAMLLAEDYFAVNHGISSGTFLAHAHKHRYRLYDAVWFWYDSSHGNVRVTGFHEEKLIGVTYWPYVTSADPAGIDHTYEWTVYRGTTTGLWYWGVHDVSRLFPALAHEIGHSLFGPGFQH